MRDDRALIQRCLDGDGAAWSELVERYQRLVYSIPRQIGLPPGEADDVFQTVWGIVLRRLETLRNEERLSAWLIRVTYRESWRWARRRRSFETLPDNAPDDAEPQVAEVARLERQALVHQGLAQLDERCRRMLTALFLDPVTPSYEDLARELGLSVGSIGPTRARCFERLERILRDRGL
jgi:RNA polymerase sigma factor (sigma-70 family)